MSSTEVYEYDAAQGLVSVHSEFYREEIQVRERVMDQVLRYSVIAELERLGYTVIPPGEES